MLEESINPLGNFSKRFCIFYNKLSQIQSQQQKENTNLGIFLAKTYRVYGSPILTEEIISIVKKYFLRQTLFCKSDEGTLEKTSKNVLTNSLTNCIFDKACQMISEGITRWVESATSK